MKPGRRKDWERVRKLTLGLRLPGIEETTSWGEPALKAHGKLWVWGARARMRRCSRSRSRSATLVEAEPGTFFITPHYRRSAMVLMQPERLDPAWARANLVRVWRAQAPKRVLRAYDDAHAGSPAAERAART